MFHARKTIIITVKLFGGLDADAKVNNYNPDAGFELEVPDRIPVRKALKKIGLGKIHPISLFINGQRARPRERLNHGDIVFCMRPMAGG